MEYELFLNFILNIIYFITIICAIKFDFGFLSIFGARFLATFIYVFILAAVTVRKFIKPSLTFDFSLMKYLFKEALPLGIFAFLLTASFKVDVFVLNYFKGPDDVSLFEAAHRVIMQLQAIPTAIVISIFPYLSRLAGESGDTLSFAFNKFFKLMLIMSLPFSILLIFMSDIIISILYSETFSAASKSLSILSFTVLFLFLISLQSFALVSKGKQVLNTISAGGCFVLNLVLDIVLVPRYGFIGASYATLISYIVFFCFSFYFVSRIIGMPPIGEVLPKPLISTGVMAGFFFVLYKGNNGIIVRGVEGVLLLVIYIVMIFVLKTFKSDEISIAKRIFLRQKLDKGIET